MGTMLKLGAGVVAATVLVVVVWSRVGDAGERRGSAGREGTAQATGARAPAPGGGALRPPAVSGASAGEASPRSRAQPEEPPAGDDEEPELALSPLERRVDQASRTFLTPEPDAAALLAAVGEVALAARVLTGTIHVDEESGRITGELEIGEHLRGRFGIEDGSYEIELDAAGQRQPFSRRSISLSFVEVHGVLEESYATVLYHPASEPGEAEGDEIEEELVGWGLNVDRAAGTTARPLAMTAQGTAWRIGQSNDLEARALPWVASTRTFDAWHALLRPHSGR